MDIERNGGEVAAELNKQYGGSKVHYVYCDVTDYYKFKGLFLYALSFRPL